MIYVTKKMMFSASHRLYNPEFNDEENEKIFDKCNNINGHGHNYVIEVTVAGNIKPDTGYLVDLKRLKDLVNKEIISKVDHKHLNLDVDFLKGIIPTVENLVVVFWNKLDKKIRNGKLHSIKLFESDGSWAEYFGEEEKIKIYK